MKTAIVTSARIFYDGKDYKIDNGINFVLERYQKYFGEITLFGMDGKDKGIAPRSTSIIDSSVNVKIVGSRNQIIFGLLDVDFNQELLGFDLIIVRSPSKLADIAARVAMRNNIPYFVEVIGDAFDSLWFHSIMAKPFAFFSFFRTRRTVLNADFALYVSQKFLQSRYPCKNYSVGISDCIVNPISEPELEKKTAEIIRESYSSISIMHAGAVDVKYKGQEYIIKAIPLLNQQGITVRLYLAGNGNLSYLKEVALKNGVSDQIIFLGGIAHDEIIRNMKNIDFYVQPSLTEALGRSVVEALSQGMICIGTDVGGIPELIHKDYLVKPKSAKDIFNKIMDFLSLSP
ncbi:TPA: glycosyltransferase, partial [Streptococcus suis]